MRTATHSADSAFTGLVPTLPTCILPTKTYKDTSRRCPFLWTVTLSADSAFMGLVPTLLTCILTKKQIRALHAGVLFCVL
ncbi:hypothetical protein [Ruminococcus sp.]|uniref:hypothetical protein n=1 Tax=Ruminococcus sp. TaxID=41978 RepID=UPI0025ECDEA6|nr:hypothetical protein [Ruminococcus sp.]MBQ9542993.1 hypothetical protein [Ruminococcus sp.]